MTEGSGCNIKVSLDEEATEKYHLTGAFRFVLLVLISQFTVLLFQFTLTVFTITVHRPISSCFQQHAPVNPLCPNWSVMTSWVSINPKKPNVCWALGSCNLQNKWGKKSSPTLKTKTRQLKQTCCNSYNFPSCCFLFTSSGLIKLTLCRHTNSEAHFQVLQSNLSEWSEANLHHVSWSANTSVERSREKMKETKRGGEKNHRETTRKAKNSLASCKSPKQEQAWWSRVIQQARSCCWGLLTARHGED